MNKPVLLVFFFISSLGFFSCKKKAPIENHSLPVKGICAHRGANETHPENTIAAFEEAVRLGAQMIEFDVQMTKDRKLVIMHDDSVNRTTNGTGLVHELTLEEIKTLDAGTWKSEIFRGEKVPTLEETLHIMPKDIWLNIHLKGDEELGAATARALIAKKRGHQGVIACDSNAAKGVRQISPNIMMCNMERLSGRSEYIEETIAKKYAFIQLKNNRNNDSLIDDIKRLKQNNILINYFHSESETEATELFKIGVDFVLTDSLSKMLKTFEKPNANNIQ